MFEHIIFLLDTLKTTQFAFFLYLAEIYMGVINSVLFPIELSLRFLVRFWGSFILLFLFLDDKWLYEYFNVGTVERVIIRDFMRQRRAKSIVFVSN